MSNIVPKWLVVTVSLVWLAVTIDRVIFDSDPNELGIRSPAVEAEIKNCTSADMHRRYECTEQAILAHQRSTFVKAVGGGALMFGPPIALWLLSDWLGRLRFGGGYAPGRRPPSIRKWRVR